MQRRSSSSLFAARRWVWPALIAVIGGSLALWASGREAQRMREIKTFVRDLCTDLADGADLAGRINPHNPAVERQIINALNQVVGGEASLMSMLDVSVTPGERSGHEASRDSRLQKATHTAMLRLADEPVLGLRIEHRGSKGIIVLGFWIENEKQD